MYSLKSLYGNTATRPCYEIYLNWTNTLILDYTNPHLKYCQGLEEFNEILDYNYLHREWHLSSIMCNSTVSEDENHVVGLVFRDRIWPDTTHTKVMKKDRCGLH